MGNTVLVFKKKKSVLPLFDENWRYQPSLTLPARVGGGFRWSFVPGYSTSFIVCESLTVAGSDIAVTL